MIRKRKTKKKSASQKVIDTILDQPTHAPESEVESKRNSTHDPNCENCNARIADPNYLWLVKNRLTRMSRHAVAPTHDEAIKLAGWAKADVLYAIITKSPPRYYGKRPTGQVSRSAARPNERGATMGARTEKSDAGRGSIFLFDHPVTSVIRRMGKEGFNFARAKGSLQALKVSPMPTDNCIRTFLYAGKAGTRGAPASLSSDELSKLRHAYSNGGNGKDVKAKVKAKSKKKK